MTIPFCFRPSHLIYDWPCQKCEKVTQNTTLICAIRLTSWKGWFFYPCRPSWVKIISQNFEICLYINIAIIVEEIMHFDNLEFNYSIRSGIAWGINLMAHVSGVIFFIVVVCTYWLLKNYMCLWFDIDLG